MSRRGENIYKRRDGRYEGRYVKGKNLNGTTRFGYIYGTQYREVKKKLIQKKNEFTKVLHARDSVILLTEWIQHWQLLKLRGRVKPTTEQTYYLLLKRYILPSLGREPLSGISAEKIIVLVTQMKKNGYSEGTITAVLRLLSAILNLAVDSELIKTNPCKQIGISKIAHRKEQRILTQTEQAILENSKEPSICIALYTGMRIGEICGLKWSDIDWNANTVTVRRTVQRVKQTNGTTRLMENTPKTDNSYRVIPLADKVRMMLETMYQSNNLYVLGKNEAICDPRKLQRRLAVITRKNGISGVHFHSLRHTFATRLIMAGVDVKTVSTLLGHSSVNITLEIYTHSNFDLKREAIRKLTEQSIKPS